MTSYDSMSLVNPEVSRELYLAGEFSDCTIICQGEEFKCHRFILATRCQVFRAMFQSTMVEGRSKVVELKELTKEVVRNMLLYIYTGTVDTDYLFEHAADMVHAADMYQLSHLKVICMKEMKLNLTEENVTDALILADTYKLVALKEAAFNFIASKNGKLLAEKQEMKRKLAGIEDIAFELMERLDVEPVPPYHQPPFPRPQAGPMPCCFPPFPPPMPHPPAPPMAGQYMPFHPPIAGPMFDHPFPPPPMNGHQHPGPPHMAGEDMPFNLPMAPPMPGHLQPYPPGPPMYGHQVPFHHVPTPAPPMVNNNNNIGPNPPFPPPVPPMPGQNMPFQPRLAPAVLPMPNQPPPYPQQRPVRPASPLPNHNRPSPPSGQNRM